MHGTTQMAIPQNSLHEEFEATYTFEAHADVTTNRTDRLPSTSAHVLEEIAADENIDVDHRGNEQNSTAAALQIENTDNTATTEVNLPFQSPTVQPEAHNSRNVHNDLGLWAKIHEYDQRMADEDFTQVLSKSQKQNLKKQVVSKPYQTCAKGGPPSSSQ